MTNSIKFLPTVAVLLLCASFLAGCTIRDHQIIAAEQPVATLFVPKQSNAKCYLFFKDLDALNYSTQSIANTCPADKLSVSAVESYKSGILSVFSLFFSNIEVAKFDLTTDSLLHMQQQGAKFFIIANVGSLYHSWLTMGSLPVVHHTHVHLTHHIEFYKMNGIKFMTVPVTSSYEYDYKSWGCQGGADSMTAAINGMLKNLFHDTAEAFAQIY